MKNMKPMGLFLGLSLSFAAQAQTWDLATDFSLVNEGQNPWVLGQYETGNQFVEFTTYTVYPVENLWTSSLQSDINGSDGIYLNTSTIFDFGILPGNVSLHFDLIEPVARWIAPATAKYNINVVIGGSRLFGLNGYGNANADIAGLKVNGIEQTPSNIINNSNINQKSWAINNIRLSQGQMIDAYVGQRDWGGNTNTVFTVTNNSIVTIDNATINPVQARLGDYVTVSAKVSGDPTKIGSVVFIGKTQQVALTDPESDGIWTGQYKIEENPGFFNVTINVKNPAGTVIAKWPGVNVTK